MNNKKILIALGIIVLIVVGIFAFRSKQSDKITYREVPVKRGHIAVSILATGTVAPENRVEIKAPVAGRAEKVLVDEGQKVKRGQVLIWMSSTERATLLDAARSKGPEEVKRWEEIYKPSPVLAPIDGTIILRNIEPGQAFTTTDSILSLSDRLTVKAQVDETDIAQITMKEPATIELDAYPGHKIPAQVDQIAFDAKTTNNVTVYTVDVLPLKPPDFLRSGMTANVTFTTAEKDDVLTVPSEAIHVKDGKNIVSIKNASNEPEDREIELGMTDGKHTEVTSGLAENDTLMIEKVNFDKKSQNTNPFMPQRPGRSGQQRSGGGGNPHGG